MNHVALQKHRLINGVQSAALLVAMAGLLSLLGWIVAGGTGIFWALVAGLALAAFNPTVSPNLILRMYRARRLDPAEAPELHRIVDALATRAELPSPPGIYYVPSEMINAFAVGSRPRAVIAVTDGMLRTLDRRELIGVLAHEMSHIRHNDMWVMGFADLFSRLTNLFSTLGQMLLLLNLPLLLFSEYTISWGAIAVLILAPTIAALMQLALSRTREYDADVGAARLSGDPEGLARALTKMQRYQGRYFEQILLPGHRVPEPSILRTHPPTEERVRRLLELEPDAQRLPDLSRAPAHRPGPGMVSPAHRPCWHLHGIWY